MNEIQAPQTTAPNPYPEMEAMSVEDLKAVVHQALMVSVESLTKAAYAIVQMQKKGANVEAMRYVLLPFFLLIAAKKLLAEVVVKFVGNMPLLKKIAALPTSTQEQLASGGKVKLLVEENGQTTHLLVDPLDLIGPQIAQVFGDGVVRDEAQQKTYLVYKRGKKKKTLPDQIDGIPLDLERHGANFPKGFVPFSTIERIYKALRK